LRIADCGLRNEKREDRSQESGEKISMDEGEKKVMKILAAQGSPRPKVSNTEILLQEFLSGARSAGAETETVYLQEKKIHPCVGCFTCWVKTPGVCIFKDDMPELLEKVRGCDILVYAFPLYNYNMTAIMKAFQERLLPLVHPHFVKTGVVYRHPPRYAMNRKMVLISNCGFPEISHFDGIRQVFRHMEKSSGAPLIGELLMPAGQLLRVEPLKEKTQVVLQAAHRAGVEVVRDGRVAGETEAQIHKPIFSADQLAGMANQIWDRLLQGNG
jgi:multimeric flavodoxin WrbA